MMEEVRTSMPYSKVWYKKLINDIPGIEYMENVSPKPGKVELLIVVEENANNETVIEELIKRMEADKGLVFQCTAILLRPIEKINLNEFCTSI